MDILIRYARKVIIMPWAQQHLIKMFIPIINTHAGCQSNCSYHKNLNRHVAGDSIDTDHTKISKLYFIFCCHISLEKDCHSIKKVLPNHDRISKFKPVHVLIF